MRSSVSGPYLDAYQCQIVHFGRQLRYVAVVEGPEPETQKLSFEGLASGPGRPTCEAYGCRPRKRIYERAAYVALAITLNASGKEDEMRDAVRQEDVGCKSGKPRCIPAKLAEKCTPRNRFGSSF